MTTTHYYHQKNPCTCSEYELTRLQQQEEELALLRQNERVDRSLTQVRMCPPFPFNRTLATNRPEHQLAFARALFLREQLKDRYLVVHHAQSFELTIVNIVIKILMKDRSEQFEFLRHPQDCQNKQPVDWFKHALAYGSDHTLRTELISGDIRLENTYSGESALDYFCSGRSVLLDHDHSIVSTLLARVIGYHLPGNQAALVKAIQEVSAPYLFSCRPHINSSRYAESTLYSLCIPKAQFNEIAYLSHPHGRPCEESFTLDHLESVQEGKLPGEIPGFPQISSLAYMDGIPQVRLLAHKLTPQEGVRIFPHYSLDLSQVSELKAKIETLINQSL